MPTEPTRLRRRTSGSRPDWHGRLREQRGVAALEFAIILPVLLIFLLGSLQVDEFVRLQMKLTEAATTMAELAALDPSTAQQSMADYCHGAQLLVWPFAGQLSVAVASVARGATSGTVGVDWQDTSCGNAPAIPNPAAMATSIVPANGNSAIVAMARYTLSLPFPFLPLASWTLSEDGFASPRTTNAVTGGTGSSGSGGSSGGSGSSGGGGWSGH